jgi:hypothetical protein
MSGTTPAAGDEVYLDNGHAVIYVAREFDGHVVRQILHEGDDENEPSYGRPQLVTKVFQSPPQEQYSADIERLREQQTVLQKEVAALRGEVSSAKAAHAQHMKELQAHPDLTRLADWIAGRVTHVVRHSYGKLEVLTFAETFTDKDKHREPGLKLLTLYGMPHGGVATYMNSYRDGSGSDTAVIPCTSREDAQAVAQKFIDEQVATWRAEPKRAHYLDQFVTCALALGLTVPEEVNAYLHAERVSRVRAHLEKTADAFAKAQGDLRSLTETTATA